MVAWTLARFLPKFPGSNPPGIKEKEIVIIFTKDLLEHCPDMKSAFVLATPISCKQFFGLKFSPGKQNVIFVS